ncbi:MAG TPA: sigma-70 family RNA polymerase sigma factor [Solirubrobacteraceae bacterium]|nr:sigma-70 family RNA polymerase sigma factor [Solirubrobacteraceae bacterium]
MARVSRWSGQTHRPATRVAATNEMVLRWQEHHDRQARDQVFAEFLPLARKLAGRYVNPHEPLEDLVQVASIGLLGAIDRFDCGRGTHFSSFAIPTILGELKRHFRDTGWSAHVPRGAQEMALRVDRATRQITAQTGRAPRVQALAEYLEVSTEDVLLGLDAGTAHYSVSLDAPAPGGTAEADGPAALTDSLGQEDERLSLVETRLSLGAAITRLPYLERQALSLRIDHDMKQVDIARELGCSQMQVSRLLCRAGARVRHLTGAD